MTRVDTHTAVDPDPEDLDLFRRSISLLEERILSAPWGRSLEGAILDALRRVPRHLFVHPANRAMAYADVALPTLAGMTTTAPSLVGYMIHLAAVRRGDRVLEIGTGTGYQAAVLAALGARVVTIECSAALAAAAGRMLGRSVAL